MDDRQIVRYPRSGTCSLRGSVCPGGGGGELPYLT